MIDAQKQIDDLQTFKRLFTAEHLTHLEKLCEVWRKNITNDALIEQFYLGKRSIYIAIKEKIETDIDQYREYLESQKDIEI
jgi:hypothetical protein